MKTLLEEQKSYYEARAAEYDEWWERRGRYDLGAERNALWREEVRKGEAVFDMAPLRGHILEPAAGSGNWTLDLARRAEKVTVLDEKLCVEFVCKIIASLGYPDHGCDGRQINPRHQF